MKRLPPRLLAGLAAVVVLAIVVSAAVVIVVRHQRHMTITAYFTETNGIYPSGCRSVRCRRSPPSRTG